MPVTRCCAHLPAPDRLIPQQNKTEIHTEYAACRLRDPFQHAFKTVWPDGTDVLPDGLEGLHLADMAGEPPPHFPPRPCQRAEIGGPRGQDRGRPAATSPVVCVSPG